MQIQENNPTFWQSHGGDRSQYIESKRLKGTHRLESAEMWRSQDNKKKPRERGTLTLWEAQRERQIRTPKVS